MRVAFLISLLAVVGLVSIEAVRFNSTPATASPAKSVEIVGRSFPMTAAKGLKWKAQIFTVDCPSGMQVTGGGYRAPQNPTNVTNVLVFSSFPTSMNAWQVRAFNGGGKADIRIYALCSS